MQKVTSLGFKLLSWGLTANIKFLKFFWKYFNKITQKLIKKAYLCKCK